MVNYAKILAEISMAHISVSDMTPINEMNKLRNDWLLWSTGLRVILEYPTIRLSSLLQTTVPAELMADRTRSACR